MFTLERIVPWGRSFDEYCRMFALRDDELTLSILGCGDGPASFNAEATRRRARVVSCDPIYRWDAARIRDRLEATYEEIIEQTRQNANEFVWTSIRSVDELGRVRMAAMNEFLNDFPAGKAEGRYVVAELPTLPFADRSFDLALLALLVLVHGPVGCGLSALGCPRDVPRGQRGSDLPIAGAARAAFSFRGHACL
jgi:hypothetical protein